MNEKFSKLNLKRFFRWTFYCILTGVLAGTATSIFLRSLAFVTSVHSSHMWLIWLLPVGGLITGVMYLKYGEEAEKGAGLILEEIHNPKNILPLAMAPLVFIGTLITHVLGGSAGREGTAIQMGSTLADQINKIFAVEAEERKILLIAGAGAAFSAAIGTPLAGAIFGLEVIQIGRLRFFAFFECLTASFVSFFFTLLLRTPHTSFPKLHDVPFNAHTLTVIIISGLIFGIAANLFIQFTHFVGFLQRKYTKTKWLFPFVGGIVLLLMFSFDGTDKFRGLGLLHIQNAFRENSSWSEPFFKAIFTGVTVGSGFKGGEFIPLVYIGTTLGSFLSSVFVVSRALLAALGFAAVFGAAANTPFACAIMAAELFGWKIAPYALLTCWIAYYLSGHIGIYKNQKLVHSKIDQLLKVFSWPQNFFRKLWK